MPNNLTNQMRNLEMLLPHRAPMLLLDAVVNYNNEFASARVDITPQTRFFDAALGGVPAWVGLEYMAQTMGIWSGGQQLTQQLPIKIGFLLGCRNYQSNCAVFAEGTSLLITAEPVYADESGLAAFNCRIETDSITPLNQVCVTAQIKAFQPEDPTQFVRSPTAEYRVSTDNTG